MRNWLRHNILGVALVAVGTLTYGATVGYPRGKKGSGPMFPRPRYPPAPRSGSTACCGVCGCLRCRPRNTPGTTIRNHPVPVLSLTLSTVPGTEGLRPSARNGACRATFVDQNYRHWYGQSGLLPMSVSQWLRKQGYDTCNTPGSFAAVMVVPKDADITAVDVEFSPAKGSGKKYRYVRFTPPA